MSEFSDSFTKLFESQSGLIDATNSLESGTGTASEFDALERALIEFSEAADSLLSSSDESTAASSNIAAETTDTNTELGTDLLMTMPLQLTVSGGGDEHPKMALGIDGNIWLTWYSTRTGSEEIYVSKYFGRCGIWNMPSQGGEDHKVSNFGQTSRKAMFPSIAVGSNGEAHIVFQGEIEGRWEIFYTHSTGGGISFTNPIRVTRSKGNSVMPDIAITKTPQEAEGSSEKVVIVWHDDRFGRFEIMSAQRTDGTWISTGQDGSDIRITSSTGDSMFPRIAADIQGNIRVVYHDSRKGVGKTGIYLSTFIINSGRWDSSGQGGADRLISNSPSDALHPDIFIDHTGGNSVAWHDLRHADENPDQREEVYAIYCPRMGQPGGACFPPLQPNIEARLDVDFKVVDCINFNQISATDVPEVCLAIRSPGATFWRASNEDGVFTDWQQFRPNFDLETTVVPWTLTCIGGQKQICMQVQDADMVGFPICQTVTLALQPPKFTIDFFKDEELSIPLPSFNGQPVSSSGDVFIRMTADVPQLQEPTFDVITRGQHLIFNQETEVVPESSGTQGSNSAGIGSFIGTTVNIPSADDVSPVAQAFSAAKGRVFKGRFSVKKNDNLLHIDGLARIIVTGRDICGPIKSAAPSKQITATSINIVRGIPQIGTSSPEDFKNPSNTNSTIDVEPEIPVDPPVDPVSDIVFTISLGKTGSFMGTNIGLGGVPPSPGGTFGNYAAAQPFKVTTSHTSFGNATMTGMRVGIQDKGSASGRYLVVELHEGKGHIDGSFRTTKIKDISVFNETTLPKGTPGIITISSLSIPISIGVQYYVVFRESLSSDPTNVGVDLGGFFTVSSRNDGAIQGPILTGAPRAPAVGSWPGTAYYSVDIDMDFISSS